MLIDHVGYLIFPQYIILRIIGRISFPIFAYFIYIGAKHTKNINKYFFKMLIAGLLMMIPTYVVGEVIWGNIMITFSASIGLIILIKKYAKDDNLKSLFYIVLYVLFLFYINSIITIDYGMIGILLPALAYIFDDEKNKTPVNIPAFCAFAVGLLILSFSVGYVQIYSLFSLFLILSYTGKIGKLNLKNFFYWFYPVHYVILLGISKLL